MDEKILEKLVSFDTSSQKSNMELIRFAKAHLKALGFKIEIQMEGNKANLFAHKDNDLPKVILASHTDTVPASRSWPTNPLKLKNFDKKFFGLGVCDMKAQIAITFSVASKAPYENLAILLTFNEETNFKGAKLASKKIIKPKDTVIIG